MFTKFINQSSVGKSFAAALFGLLMVAAILTPVAPARAQTVAELQAQINQLIAQLQSLQNGGSVTVSTVCPYYWNRNLGIGSTGADVLRLQQFLNTSADTRLAVSGAGSPGMETQYYGPITANAVSRFQAKYRAQVLLPIGLVNPTGYFGPMSRAEANDLCVTPTGGGNQGGNDNNDQGQLEGGAGSISDADFVSSLNNEEVGEGEDDVEVAGLNIEADDSSDIEVTAVTLNFDQGTADRDFKRYASDVSVWFNGDKVADIDADEFDDDNGYSRTLSLDRGVIIRAGDTEELTVAVSALNNIDSADEGETWDVTFDSVRFRDAQGAVVSDSSTGDIGSSRTFSFENFASASNLDLRIKNGDDGINDAQTVAVSNNDETDEVEILSFRFDLEGDSDVEIKDLPIKFTATGANVGDIINSAEVLIDGDVVGSESVSSNSSSATVVFNDLDYTIDAGDSVEVVVRVDVNELGGSFTEGDSLYAEFGETQTDSSDFDAEDEEGNDIADADVSGSVTSEDHTFYAAGLDMNFLSSTESTKDTNGDTAGGEQGVYTLKFEVTAFDEDIYIPTGATTATSTIDTDDGIAYLIEDGNGDEVDLSGGASSNAAVSTTADISGNYYVIREGQTKTFTLNITFTPASDGFYRAQLYGINYNVGSAGAADTQQRALPESDFDSDYVDIDA